MRQDGSITVRDSWNRGPSGGAGAEKGGEKGDPQGGEELVSDPLSCPLHAVRAPVEMGCPLCDALWLIDEGEASSRDIIRLADEIRGGEIKPDEADLDEVHPDDAAVILRYRQEIASARLPKRSDEARPTTRRPG